MSRLDNVDCEEGRAKHCRRLLRTYHHPNVGALQPLHPLHSFHSLHPSPFTLHPNTPGYGMAWPLLSSEPYPLPVIPSRTNHPYNRGPFIFKNCSIVYQKLPQLHKSQQSIPLFSISPNIQESESASKKRTHDKYVDGAYHLNSQGISSENCSDQKSVQISTSAVDCLPSKSSSPSPLPP
ncbi:hypothetical protein F4778DRAFT_191267 [Xylariomycetidae sp. FL2044]|nr:hypothetical protein F4778DRAFT_191267 [Xylariomycetidae sp. FL2044]